LLAPRLRGSDNRLDNDRTAGIGIRRIGKSPFGIFKALVGSNRSNVRFNAIRNEHGFCNAFGDRTASRFDEADASNLDGAFPDLLIGVALHGFVLDELDSDKGNLVGIISKFAFFNGV
jgi:hypothetical protein